VENNNYSGSLFSSDKLENGEDPYEKREMLRRKAAILCSDDEKFGMFMKLMRIALMLDKAKITHKKIVV
jgi:hypothetical protein